MRVVKPALILAILLMILCASGMAFAADGHRGGGHGGGGHGGGGHGGGHHGGSHVGVVIGGSFWGSPWYYPSYYPYYYPFYYPYYYPYYYPPAVSVPSTPPTYIERARPESSSKPFDLWFYCPGSKTYYPYVKECPGGWETVPAKPPSGSGR